MIIDRTWNKKNRTFTISYLDKNGMRKIYNKQMNYWKTYEYNPNGKMTTWDGKKCEVVFKDASKYSPNEFDQLEFMYNLPKDMYDELFAMRFPKIYFSDIETEIDDEFPEPTEAKQRIQLISLVAPDLSVMVIGIKPLDEAQKEELRERYLKYIDDNEFARNLVKKKDFNIRVFYQSYDTEEQMLEYWYTKLLPKIGCLAGWNYYRFDWQYIWNRTINLFGKFKAMQLMRSASPTGELSKISWTEMDETKYSIPCPQHCMIWDYMELVKSYEYSMRPYESYSLDWVGSHGVNAHKVKYEGTMKECYEKDYPLFVYYNAIDSCLNALIHYRFKCIESPCSMATVVGIPAQKALGQVALTTANLFRCFYDEDKHVVWDYDAVERTKVQYEGAFCGCVPGFWNYVVCDDFASLYPSVVMTCNISMESIVKNEVGPDSLGRYTEIPWTEEELDKFRADPNYFVSLTGVVFKNDQEYTFSKMQRKQKERRNHYKYLNWEAQGKLMMEVDRLIEIREKEKKESA